MWSNASASTRTSSRRSPISMRGPRSPPSTRAATCAIRRSGAATREATAKPPASAASAASAPARRNSSRTARLARSDAAVGSPTPARATTRPPTRRSRTRSSTRPTSGRSWTEKPGGAARNARPARFSRACCAALSRSSAGSEPEELGLVGDRARPRDRGHEERRGWSAGTARGRGSRGRARRPLAGSATRATRPARARPCRSGRPVASAPRALCAVPAYTAAKAIPMQTTTTPTISRVTLGRRPPRRVMPPAAGTPRSARSRSAPGGRDARACGAGSRRRRRRRSCRGRGRSPRRR